MPEVRGGIAHFDINKTEDLQALIDSGAIWKGGPKTISRALTALRTGECERPANLPQDIADWLDRNVPTTPEEKAAGVTEEELAAAPPAEDAALELEADSGPPTP
jgi:hypothetical protein